MRAAICLLAVLGLLVAACSGGEESTANSEADADESADVGSTASGQSTTTTTPPTESSAPTATTATGQRAETDKVLDEVLEERRASRMMRLGIATGSYQLDPTDEQFECMTSDEAMTMPLDAVDEESLPLILIEMCMEPQMTEAFLSSVAALPGVSAEVLADLTCIAEHTADRIEGASLEERLATTRSAPTADEQPAMAEACDLTDADLAAVSAVVG